MIQDALRSGHFNQAIFITTMHNIANYVTDNTPIVDNYFKQYDAQFHLAHHHLIDGRAWRFSLWSLGELGGFHFDRWENMAVFTLTWSLGPFLSRPNHNRIESRAPAPRPNPPVSMPPRAGKCSPPLGCAHSSHSSHCQSVLSFLCYFFIVFILSVYNECARTLFFLFFSWPFFSPF